ncbi:MAG TPA: 2-oxoglutarate and iron-dependent oxygenase domain-containing protein [Acidimicrobiales bacterium]|nr:2-oxoglutarate and iron-dependent oxygenase domain-containing protein [Acidimicrobiales bacterium]
MSDSILDVDLLAFETGSAEQRRAVVDGVMRSLETGFVYTSHDMSERLIDDAYARLRTFFELPAEAKQEFVAAGTHGQTGYTGLLVETAATSDVPDWKEMLNWSRDVPAGHPLRRKYPHRYMDQVIPDVAEGMRDVLMEFHESVENLQRRFLRIIAVGLGAHEDLFESMVGEGATLTRAIRYPPMHQAPGQAHVWAGEHGDINLITALPRATTRGLQVRTDGGWVDAAPPDGHVIINTGIMLERLSNGAIPIGMHRVVADPDSTDERYSVVQFMHPTPWTILSPLAGTVTADRPQRFGGVEAGDLLDQVLYDINLVEDARRVD